MTDDEQYRSYDEKEGRELLFPMKRFQVFPKDAKPIEDWDKPNEAYQNVIERLKIEIKKLSGV